ncbi:MAG TPA: PepSY domain-containing protein [Noviherbaspirillum sp.]|nr:PepSY domain-containing protein [Noviherbaspirillum sp.]
MRTSRLFSILAISAGLIGGSALLSPAFSQSGTPAISYAQSDLSMAQVEVLMMAAGYGNIDKIERERTAFEVNASDKNGARVQLYVDPQTGGIIKTGRQERTIDHRAGDLASAK